MIRLLNSNFARFRMNSLFWIGILAAAVLGIVCPTLCAWLNVKLVYLTEGMIGYYIEEGFSLDYYFFTWVPFVIVFFALFCSCYMGTEHSDGTLRNKIVAGHSRTGIYLSNFITSAVVGCIFFSVYMAASLCAGIPFLGNFQLFNREEVLTYVLCIYGIMIAFAAIFTMSSMLVSNKAIAVVICICIVVVLFLIPIDQTDALQWQEFFNDDFSYAGITYAAGSRNPFYIGGIRRAISVFFLDFLPGGPLVQFYRMFYLYGEHGILSLNPYVMSGGILFFIVAPTVAGILLFRKMGLK